MSTPLSLSCRFCTVKDADASVLPPWSVTGAVWMSLGGHCSTAGGSITFRLVFSDTEGNLTGVSGPFTLTAATGAPDWGAAWLGTPGAGGTPSLSVAADQMILKVDAITGNWQITSQGFYPEPAVPTT
jgi:hypothetical protein